MLIFSLNFCIFFILLMDFISLICGYPLCRLSNAISVLSFLWMRIAQHQVVCLEKKMSYRLTQKIHWLKFKPNQIRSYSLLFLSILTHKFKWFVIMCFIWSINNDQWPQSSWKKNKITKRCCISKKHFL